MVRLTCLLRRRAGLSPEEFHRYWRERHGPLVASTTSGSYVVRYEQHPRPMEDYGETDDGGFDGVTVQWFSSMEDYQASLAAPDFAEVVMVDIPKFLDVDRLHFVVTEEPIVVIDGATPPSTAGS